MNTRRGTTAVELVSAAVVLAAVGAVMLPIFTWQARQQQTSEEHLEALTFLSNVLDSSVAQPYEQVTTDSLSATDLPGWVADQFTNPELIVTVEPKDEGKLISAVLWWHPSHGGPRTRVRLDAWVYPEGGS